MTAATIYARERGKLWFNVEVCSQLARGAENFVLFVLEMSYIEQK